MADELLADDVMDVFGEYRAQVTPYVCFHYWACMLLFRPCVTVRFLCVHPHVCR